MQRIIIYQVLPRLFGNDTVAPVPHGDITANGVGKMAHFTAKALAEIRALGATHIWYTGLLEHATQTDYSAYGISPDHPAVVKGKAGSPYAIKDYYDIDPDLATQPSRRMHEFELLVRRTHRAGLKVVIDFVPNHVARHYASDSAPAGVHDLGQDDDTTRAFDAQNNFYYIPSAPFAPQFPIHNYHEYPAKATGNDCFSASPGTNDWYETVKLNYGIDYQGGHTQHFHPVPNTWHQMLHILLFWAGKGVDALRCDMAEMVPVDFWHWAIAQVKEQYPHVEFIAEVYNPALYRSYLQHGGFDYLYDKVGLYDTLRAVVAGRAPAGHITHCWQQLEGIGHQMLHFLENHDEQRLASPFFAGDPLQGRAPLLVSALMHTSPMMIYFGQELGERGMDAEGYSGTDGRTTIFDYWAIDSIRRWRDGGRFSGQQLTQAELQLRAYYARVLGLCNSHPALRQGAFFDLMYVNPQLQRQYAFVRHTPGHTVLVVANFDTQPAQLALCIPQHLFHVLQLEPQAQCQWHNLLTDTHLTAAFSPSCPTLLDVPALDGCVLSLQYS